MNLAHVFQLLAFVAGLAVFRKAGLVYVRVLIVLLAITVINELVVVPYIKQNNLFNRNVAYNIFSLLDMAAWFFILHRIIQSRTGNRLTIVFAAVAFAWSFLEINSSGWNALHVDSFRFYEVAVILLSIYYLYTLMKREYYRFIDDPKFWLCSAVIIYHSVLFLSFTTLVENNYWNIPEANSIFVIFVNINNVIYYTLICAAFASIYYRHRKRVLLQES